MFYHVPIFPTGAPAVSPEPSKKPESDSLPPTLCCCRKILLVQVMMSASFLLHFLCMVTAVSAYIQGSGQTQYSHPESSRNNSRKLAIFGCLGVVANGLALTGLLKKQRVFLIPALLFLAATLVLDGVLALAYITSHTINNSGVDSGSDIMYLSSSMLALSIQTSSNNMIVLSFLKLVLTIFMFRCVLDVYRKDLSLRSTRSPFRSQMKDLRASRAEEGNASPLKSPKLREYTRFV